MAVPAAALAQGTDPPQSPDLFTGRQAEEPDEPETAGDRIVDPDSLLGNDWSALSDRAVTVVGDAVGLHVLVADRQDAYQWRTVATLSEPMLEADQWIGQHCVTGSGNRAVVVYAPRTFTNYSLLMEGGAFAAVVDLDTGGVHKLDQRVTLAYFNPACGVDETAVVSRLEQSPQAGKPAKTWVGTVDTQRGRIEAQVRADGQLTSAVPVGGRVLAARGYSLVELGAGGEVTVVANTNGSPLRLVPEGRTGLAFQVARQDQVDLARLASGRVQVVETVPLGTVKLRPGAGGDVYAVGVRATEQVDDVAPARWRVVDGLPDGQPSTSGGLLVTRAGTGQEPAGQVVARPHDGNPLPVHVTATLVDTAVEVEFTVQPWVGVSGQKPSPSLGPASRLAAEARPGDAGIASTEDPATVPWDPDRACAVPRNHPEYQVYQPSAEEVEWAVNLAVKGELTIERPVNWLNSGNTTSYSPQSLFPRLPLAGGGEVPSQIMLAIVAQESNMYQASWRVVDGLGGNPLVPSGFYGLHWNSPDPRQLDWNSQWVDCGYGVAQVTTGMRSSDTGQLVTGLLMSPTRQRAVAQDFAVNVAAGLRILQEKWNLMHEANIIANNGDPKYLENWWFAVWAYNSGFQPDHRFGNTTGCTPSPSCTDADGNWGLGWSNNPASPLYPEDRQMFLTAPLDHPDVDPPDNVGYDNARHPNHWSYPERVMGFAYESLRRWDYQAKEYRTTYWPTLRTANTPAAQPSRFRFCDPLLNNCLDVAEHEPGEFPDYPAGPCLRDDLRCWWHSPATWGAPGCDWCGTERPRFQPGTPPSPMADPIHSSRCTTAGLPTGSLVVNTIHSVAPLGPRGCPLSWTVGGSFEFEYGSLVPQQGAVVYPSKVNLHQINGGFGGHFWVSETQEAADNQPIKLTGRWTLDPIDAWTRVFVHMPDHGAHTRQARYEITLPDGSDGGHRAIPTNYEANTWVDIGVFDFTGTGNAVIELTNFTRDGGHAERIAWDAIAVQPLPAKPEHFVVAMGDSYSSGDGASPSGPGDVCPPQCQPSYYFVSDQYGDNRTRRNACRRSPYTWSRQIQLAGAPDTLGSLADQHHPEVDYHLIACSGARTHNLLRYGTTNNHFDPPRQASGQWGELTQVEQGFLDENTTLVTLSIGGNDSRFTSVVEACIGPGNCAAEDFILPGDPEPLHLYAPWFIENTVVPSINQVLDEIRTAAPNAHIQLMGYPQLLAGPCGGLFGHDEIDLLNELAVILDARYTALSIRPNVDVLSTVDHFRGHGACGSASWINGPVLVSSGGGDNTSPPSMESFHPNRTGYAEFGALMSGRLETLGYTW